jgi:hypothetical protein
MSGVVSEGVKSVSSECVKGECVKGKGWTVCALGVSPFTLHPSPFTYQLGCPPALS